MRRDLISLCLMLSALAILPATVAHADDDDDRRRGRSEYKVEYERGGCEYEYRESRKGYREKLECDGIWRDIERQKYEYETNGCKYKYEADRHGYEEKYECKRGWSGYGAPHRPDPALVFQAPSNAALGIAEGRCDHELMGRILGGLAGAAVGSQVGKGDGRTAAVIGGTVLGMLVGGSIGRDLDEADQYCVGQALEHAPDRQTVRWADPDGGARYAVTPTSTEPAGEAQYCREYVTEVVVGGRVENAYGRACRQPDGSWQRVR